MPARKKKLSNFDRLVHSLSARGTRNPKALAAWIGDRKFGKRAMQAKARKGRRAARRRRQH